MSECFRDGCAEGGRFSWLWDRKQTESLLQVAKHCKKHCSGC